MDQLLNSRLNKPESQIRFESESPDKFGKGAFASLTYTPSKLASNVIYKEVTNMKKIQEGSSKMRQSQALNSFFKDKLRHLQAQRDGIEQSLTSQIVMYKKMLIQMQNTQQQRIRQLQCLFSQQMQRVIRDKEEEAKYVQSEKQLLQNRIYELQNIIAELKQALNNHGSDYDILQQEHQKLKRKLTQAGERNEELVKEIKQKSQNFQKQIEALNRKLFNADVDWKAKLDKIQLQAEKQKQQLLKSHRSQLDKIEDKRMKELEMKNEQQRQLMNTFKAESNRLNDLLISKDKAIEVLNNNLKQQKDKFLQMTKTYTAEIAQLTGELNKFKQNLQNTSTELVRSRQNLIKLTSGSNETVTSLEQTIKKLKEDLELTQINYIRQKEKHAFQVDDLKQEVIILRKNVGQINFLMDQNSVLCKQVRNLKDLLMESARQMQRCKQEFVRLGKQKQHLISKLRELDMENEALHRVKLQRQEEARGWRQTYYMSRRG